MYILSRGHVLGVPCSELNSQVSSGTIFGLRLWHEGKGDSSLGPSYLPDCLSHYNQPPMLPTGESRGLLQVPGPRMAPLVVIRRRAWSIVTPTLWNAFSGYNLEVTNGSSRNHRKRCGFIIEFPAIPRATLWHIQVVPRRVVVTLEVLLVYCFL